MIILASASPRRKDLLSTLIKDFSIMSADIDETVWPHELASDYVVRMAQEKAYAVMARLETIEPQTLLIGADTSVVIEGQVLGKPDSLASLTRMLSLLSDKTHEVMTSVCVVDANTQRRLCVNVVTEVTFRVIDQHEMVAYWHSGEPQDKAGGYAIQGLGAIFVKHMSGSYSAVVGLPLFEVGQLLQSFGVDPLGENK